MSVILPESNLPRPAEHFAWVPAPWGAVLQCEPLAALAPHFFTTRSLGFVPTAVPRQGQAQDDWGRVAAAIGVTPARIHRMHQVHGCTAVPIYDRGDSPDTGNPAIGSPDVGNPDTVSTVPPEADALVTDARDVALAVRVADCVPLLMADRRTGAVAAVHAGWRGTAAGIAAAAVRRLQQEYGSRPDDVVAAIGPSIGACCYQVGPSVLEGFQHDGHSQALVATWFSPDEGDRLRLDQWAANRDQLIAAGVPAGQVYIAQLCTMTHLSVFYSYRAEGRTGRLLGVIRRPA
jgi:polyphenol oxidase